SYFTFLYTIVLLYFFFHDSPTTEFYTLSLHDALPIWVHGAGRLLERLPVLLGAGPPDVLGLHGRQGHAEPRPGPRDAGRRAHVAPASAPRHEVERRQAVHRRRLRVLVRGRLSQQGPRAHAVGGHGDQRQAGRDPEGRHPHGEV